MGDDALNLQNTSNKHKIKQQKQGYEKQQK